MKEKIFIILVVILILPLLYGIISVGKKLSFNFFYEDMVRATVVEMVKASALKEIEEK